MTDITVSISSSPLDAIATVGSGVVGAVVGALAVLAVDARERRSRGASLRQAIRLDVMRSADVYQWVADHRNATATPHFGLTWNTVMGDAGLHFPDQLFVDSYRCTESVTNRSAHTRSWSMGSPFTTTIPCGTRTRSTSTSGAGPATPRCFEMAGTVTTDSGDAGSSESLDDRGAGATRKSSKTRGLQASTSEPRFF